MHQPQTLGKRSRQQLVQRLDQAAAGRLPRTARDEELPEAPMHAAGLGRARLPPGSYRNEEVEEVKEEVAIE
jgi:hypothetical protein